jgi:hypothetical protein
MSVIQDLIKQATDKINLEKEKILNDRLIQFGYEKYLS